MFYICFIIAIKMILLKIIDKSFPSKFAKNRITSPLQNQVANYHQGAVHPVTGKKPPTLEEFDPLNPGEWQIGVAGKILPRLPEGTRVGNLVMGKYGLYYPPTRKHQIEFWEGTHYGTSPSEDATPRNAKFRNIAVLCTFLSILVIIHNSVTIFWGTEGKHIWPNTIIVEKRKKLREGTSE